MPGDAAASWLSVTSPTVRPASSRALVASACVLPTTSGTVTPPPKRVTTAARAPIATMTATAAMIHLRDFLLTPSSFPSAAALSGSRRPPQPARLPNSLRTSRIGIASQTPMSRKMMMPAFGEKSPSTLATM